MLHMSHPPPVNGVLGSMSSAADANTTIDPATLGHSDAIAVGSFAGSRGVKRSRSPESQFDAGLGQLEDDSKSRKRGRPPKAVKITDSPGPAPPLSAVPSMAQTPQSAQHPQSHASPPYVSPTKSTPTKTPVLKALPTVRDHTSNELNEQGDEYLPREVDEAGETKVAPNGAPLGGRQYRCRTFYMPNRGDRLFMLATECAKVLNYRDSYLLFNKNRSLFKIIANQIEKNELILQEILPSSYRARQIAIVTARSMYRQFGSRLIVNGRRVRDDYWESKARKQGFTEEDMAGEKRPGAAKAREAAQAAHEASNAAALAALPTGPIMYSTAVGNADGPMGQHSQGLPMIQTMPHHDLGDYSSVQRPRHDITGSAYHDKSQPSAVTEMMGHATQSADFNQNLARQRASRGGYLESIWRQPHEASHSQQTDLEADAAVSAISQPQRSSPQSAVLTASQSLTSQTPQSRHSMIPASGYGQQQQVGHGLVGQSPRGAPQPLPSSSIHHRSPTMPMNVNPSYGQPQYSYGQPVWSAAPSQSSSQVQQPLQYGHGLQQPSPHMQQTAIHPGQLHQGPNSAGLPGMGYNPNMGGLTHSGYPGVPRQMYQPGQQYMQQQAQTTQPGMQNWPPQAQGGQQPWQQQNF